MPGKQLQVRLPLDHWVWRISDPRERSLEVRQALDFYQRFGKNIEAVRQAAQEIKAMLQQGSVVLAVNGEAKNEPEEDPRFAALDKFLEF